MAILVMSIISIIWNFFFLAIAAININDGAIAVGAFEVAFMFTIATSVVGIIQGNQLRKLKKKTS